MAWAVFFAAMAAAAVVLRMENLAVAAGLVAVATGWRPLVRAVTRREWRKLRHAWKRWRRM